MLRGVVFDFDGVLVDSEYAHFEAIRDTLQAETGIVIDHAEYLEHYLAYDDHSCFRRAFERNQRAASPERLSQLVEQKWKAYARRIASVPFLPGAAALVRDLAGRGVPLAIASGSRRNEIETLLSAQALRECFRGLVTADDVLNFKPHPEPYLRACLLLGAEDSAQGFVAIEDSSTGIAAARAAGLRVIGVAGSLPLGKLGLAHQAVASLTELSFERLAALASEGI